MRKSTYISTVLIALFYSGASNAVLIGPTPYLCFDSSAIAGCGTAESPFAGTDYSGGYFYLEDFEDGLFNTPGVTASAGFVTSTGFATIRDSVDEDDGIIDGTGSPTVGDSYFSSGPTGILFTFDAGILGALPTSAGLVWTDGAGTISFEAFGPGGSLGMLAGDHANGSFNGETDEDRFYGVSDLGGIASLFISNSSGGIEIDHLQYGNPDVNGNGEPPTGLSEPGSLTLMFLGLIIFGYLRRRNAIIS